jgi:hypothetical protein
MAALAALVFLAGPAVSQPLDSVKLDRAVAEAGRWSEQLGRAINTGTEAFEELNGKVQSLAGTGLAGPAAAAAAPGIRQLIERNRANLIRSNAMLAALPPYPAGVPTEISGESLVADARAQNGRLLRLLGDYEAVFEAMGKNDSEALKRAMPRMMEGAFALVGQQKLLFRNRQAIVPASDSTHQALGIAVQIYRTMEAVARQTVAVRFGDAAGSAEAAAALRDEMKRVAADTAALAAAGRRNLKREMNEFESLRRSSASNPAEARLADRALGVTALEEKTFEVGDRLAAFAAAQAQSTAQQLRQAAGSSLLSPIARLESDYMDVAAEQAALTGSGPE